jgi:hypothetical protein
MIEIIKAVARQLIFSIFLDYKYIIIYLFFYIVVKGRLEIINGFEHSISGCRSRSFREIVEELLLVGLLSGFFGGILTTAMGLSIEPEGLQSFLVIMVFLALINHRFVNPSYAGGLICLYSLIFTYDKVHIPSMLMLIAVFQLFEAICVYLGRKEDNIPIFIRQNGQITGAFIKQKYYAIPFILLTFSSAPYALWKNEIVLTWKTAFSAGLMAAGGMASLLVGAIGVTNYSSISISTKPEEKCRNDAIKFLIGSLLLFLLAFFSDRIELLKWIGSLFALLYREFIYRYTLHRERKKEPLYTVAKRGLRILEVIPGGTADRMKVKRGEIILNLNGKPVQSEDGIRHILSGSPTFLWMHTQDENGQVKIYEHKCYPDGVKDLDVIVVPKEWEVTYQVDEYENFTIIKNIVEKFRFKR